MPFLTGKAPSVENSTNSTINPSQSGNLSNLLAQLGVNVGTTGTAASPAYTQPLTAQITAPQQATLNNIGNTSNALGGVAPAAAGGVGTATTALTNVANATPANFSQYFQNSVVQPLENSFTQQTIPNIEAAFGQSAGGTKGSGYGEAIGQATSNLNNTIASNASSTALAQYNNQQTNSLNAAAGLDNNALASLTGQSNALNAQALPQTTQQTTYSNAYQEFLNQLAQNNTISGQEFGADTAGTQQTNSIVNPGYQGLLQQLMQETAGIAGSVAGKAVAS